jgi:hypothetical protein
MKHNQKASIRAYMHLQHQTPPVFSPHIQCLNSQDVNSQLFEIHTPVPKHPDLNLGKHLCRWEGKKKKQCCNDYPGIINLAIPQAFEPAFHCDMPMRSPDFAIAAAAAAPTWMEFGETSIFIIYLYISLCIYIKSKKGLLSSCFFFFFSLSFLFCFVFFFFPLLFLPSSFSVSSIFDKTLFVLYT